MEDLQRDNLVLKIRNQKAAIKSANKTNVELVDLLRQKTIAYCELQSHSDQLPGIIRGLRIDPPAIKLEIDKMKAMQTSRRGHVIAIEKENHKQAAVIADLKSQNKALEDHIRSLPKLECDSGLDKKHHEKPKVSAEYYRSAAAFVAFNSDFADQKAGNMHLHTEFHSGIQSAIDSAKEKENTSRFNELLIEMSELTAEFLKESK